MDYFGDCMNIFLIICIIFFVIIWIICHANTSHIIQIIEKMSNPYNQTILSIKSLKKSIVSKKKSEKINMIHMIAYRFFLFLLLCLECLVFSIIYELDTKTQKAKLPVVPARDSACIQVPLHYCLLICFHRPWKGRWGWLPDVVCELLGSGMVPYDM